MTRRTALAALAFALPLVVAACDSGLPGKSEGAEAMMEETGEEPLPPSHEGEACEGHQGEVNPCGVDGEEGVEFCAYNNSTYGLEWSACFTESCETQGASQPCDEGGVAGTQVCITTGESLVWGLCVTDPECTAGETESCGLDWIDLNKYCQVDSNGVPHWGTDGCDTPLVLSFDGRAPAFSIAPASAAAFDISGAGRCTNTDWPTAATPWLALDRDRNGTIDGGHELFGNGTRMLAGGKADHGFAALAELDSDRDGRITDQDARFAELVLWSDHDGDRRSSGWELLPLAAYGVEAIELEYRRDRVCDARGNCGIERASFTFRDGGRARSGEVVDVYLACAE
ncbi:MAG: calcium-binding protein [Nannocystaceae bacterium]